MATALDYNADTNPGGQLPYQWTNWQDTFRPRLGGQMQPNAGQTGAQIIDQRQATRDQVIQANPLWAAWRKPAAPAGGMMAGVSDAGSSEEDAQSMFGAVQDGGTAPPVPGTPPVAAASTGAVAPGTNRQFMPSASAFPGRSIATPYGTASVTFNNTARLGGGMYAAGGSKLRF